MNVRLITLIARHPSLTRGQFLARWSGHARVVHRHAAALGIRRHVHMRSVPMSPVNIFMRIVRGTLPGFDGAEVSWVDRDDFAERLHTEAGQAAWREVLRSELAHADFSRGAQWLASEHVLRAGKRAARPLLWAGRGLAALSLADFQRHYLERHGPLVAGLADLVGIDRYVQAHLLADGLNAELRDVRAQLSGRPSTTAPFPVAAEITWDLAPLLRAGALAASRDARREIAADERRHIDFARSAIWQCEAHEVF